MASESFLDGKTILRFSNNMDMTGGLGQHLSGLDRELLGCNSATIIRFYYTSNVQSKPCEHAIGKGRLIEIPLARYELDHHSRHQSYADIS